MAVDENGEIHEAYKGAVKVDSDRDPICTANRNKAVRLVFIVLSLIYIYILIYKLTNFMNDDSLVNDTLVLLTILFILVHQQLLVLGVSQKTGEGR